MDYAELQNLVEELSEVPYIESEVTHIFTSGNRKLLSLQYSKAEKQFLVSHMELGQTILYNKAEQAAAAILEALESLEGTPSNL
ncbi:hypothetical protein A8F94_21945 [Bacillus sp. FJAT-27225]|uniref:hypothetical protein n=1 Tax=Bacillus sp. FJAT-27225 TaxID=1743144 RepID=UPI00080C33FC|nr:hypothetical protein [Bacillus sp. FJAT-27225]OCA81539.1 hypothetical protein A8F94_21945 [Bacillus sp. FJAT-27225]